MEGIEKSLDKVLGGDFCGVHVYYLQKVIALVGYFSEDDLNEAEMKALNDVNAALLKHTNFECMISHLERYVDTDKKDILLEMMDRIFADKNPPDVASLLMYIKRKARKAGDI